MNNMCLAQGEDAILTITLETAQQPKYVQYEVNNSKTMASDPKIFPDLVIYFFNNFVKPEFRCGWVGDF